jgi:hypothetical protein
MRINRKKLGAENTKHLFAAVRIVPIVRVVAIGVEPTIDFRIKSNKKQKEEFLRAKFIFGALCKNWFFSFSLASAHFGRWGNLPF